MSLFVFIGCIAAAVFTSYTHGNKQANDLMVKLGGPIQNHYTWGKYKISLDYIFYWLIPLIAAVIVFGWLGLLYLPFVWLMVAKLSQVFMVGQLRKRLTNAISYYDEDIKKWEADGKPRGYRTVNINQAEHSVNELKWLMSHPKMAHHLALSALDDKAHPAVVAKFEHQVSSLDTMTRQQREDKKGTSGKIDLSTLYADDGELRKVPSRSSEQVSSKLEGTVEHAIKNIKSIMDDKDKSKSNKIMEAFATTLVMSSKFAEHGTDEDSKWFVDEVSYVTSKDASTASIFNFYALGFIHAQSTEAYKASEQGASDELPEVSAVVLGSTRAIYEAVMKKVVSDNKTRGHEDKR